MRAYHACRVKRCARIHKVFDMADAEKREKLAAAKKRVGLHLLDNRFALKHCDEHTTVMHMKFDVPCISIKESQSSTMTIQKVVGLRVQTSVQPICQNNDNVNGRWWRCDRDRDS